ncbi:MAG: PAS domain-containing protein [Sandaracinaceae bacterium]|nr:PAS domain-containing protein [Sandaracinaceae bacterium]
MSSTSTSAEATLDALADPVLVCGVDGRLSFINAAAARLLGESVEAMIGRPAASLLPPRIRTIEDVPFVEWLVAAWERHRRPIRVPVLRHDGVEIHQAFQVTTTTIEGLGTVVVLVLRPPDEALELDEDPLDLDTRHPSAERSYRALFEAVPVGVLHFDAGGRITAVNELLADELGSTRGVLIGLDMLTLPNDALREAVGEALAGRVGSFDGAYTSVTSGRMRLFRATFSPIVRDGRVEGGVGIVDDVTERREIEARLAQGERMASLGRLAAGVAHEINNPLAYVRTSLELARREVERLAGAADPASVQRARQALLQADDGVERVRVIASDLKTFSRGDEGSWQPVDLRRVVDAAVNLAWNEIRHRAELVRELAPVPSVMGSETRYVQVLVNLLVNAAHALDDAPTPERRITIRLGEAPTGGVFLEVEDTGHGIASDVVGRIFEPFWTSKPKTRGTGLGLSICHGIVTSAGGTIRVARTAPGVGTTFRVDLPAVGAPARAASPTSEPGATPVPQRRGSVLVIDDEPRLAVTIRLALIDHADVQIAEGGAAALEALAGEATFDLVLCDLMMPEVNGMDVYERVRESRPDLATRFVFMTGGAFTDRARDFLKHSGVPRLDKPFALADVERLLLERLAE